MRRLTDDRGGVAVIVVILLPVVLLGFGALVLDVGSLYAEKRQLQNGADAAALAIANDCVNGSCGTPATTATELANDNTNDGSANVEDVCGNATGLTACVDPPTVPAGAGYVRVKVQTGDTSGPGLMPPILGRVVDPSYNGRTLHAQATAVWGGPAGIDAALPLTISECEYNRYVGSPAVYASPLPSPVPSLFAWTTYAPDKVIYLHDTTGASGCLAGPSGADNLSGGFGWLSTTNGDCTATTDLIDTFDDKTGVPPPSDCNPGDFSSLLGKPIVLPLYDSMNALNGTNTTYHMGSYVTFVLTGYSIVGKYQHKSIVTGTLPCSGSATCISGLFLSDPVDPETADTVGGAGTGATVIQLLD